jgi:hypothetical protein
VRISLLVTLLTIFAFINPALAVDHNNIDAGRPLSFDDAESVGFGEQSLEFGSSVVFPQNKTVGGQFSVEYLHGVILNGHISIGIDPAIGGRTDNNDTDFDIGNLSVGFFYNFNREYDDVPAFAVRTDVALPTGSGSQGVDFRLRGIASKTVGDYDRLHLNLDLDIKTNPDTGDRSIIPGLILGYSRPIGYPERFDRTLVGEIGVLASQESDGSAVIRTGVGMRQQIGLQNVLDFGVEGDINTGNGGDTQLRVKIGYSFGF